MPDDTKKGKKNIGGLIGQYPYFAPDENYLKKAPKMTKADELYLKKFVAAVPLTLEIQKRLRLQCRGHRKSKTSVTAVALPS